MSVIPDPVEVNDEVIDLGHGVSVQWLADGQIVSFRLEDVTRKAIDTWVDATMEATHHFEDRPMRVMHQLSSFTITPYAKQRTAELATATAHMTGRTAILLPKSILNTMVKLFVDRDLNKSSKGFVRRLFTDRDEALAWLLSD